MVFRVATKRQGFTLIELLVVIAIIVLASAMAVPAVSKFTRGQALQNAGRLLQSAFNEARRASITSRKQHYLVLFHERLENPVREVFGLRVFQRGRAQGDGYTSDTYRLPPNVVIQTETTNAPVGLYGVVQEPTASPPGADLVIPGTPLSGCRVAVFNECPHPGPTQFAAAGIAATGSDWIGPAVFTQYFQFPNMTPITTSTAFGWIEFQRDGTVLFQSGTGGARDVAAYQPVTGESLYDLNRVYPENLLIEDQIKADLTLRQSGEPKKRCYLDIDPNTGRVRYRVVALNGYSGAAGGIGTTTDPGGTGN